jgi:hypothetical protein
MTQDFSFFTCIPMAVFNTASLTGTYQSLNSSGFLYDIKILKIYNGGTTGITISYDNGVTDHDFFPAGSTQILDLQTNHSDNSSNGAGTLNGRARQILMGKGTAGTGNLYIIGYR